MYAIALYCGVLYDIALRYIVLVWGWMGWLPCLLLAAALVVWWWRGVHSSCSSSRLWWWCGGGGWGLLLPLPLYCNLLYRSVSYGIALHCVVLYCIVLCCTLSRGVVIIYCIGVEVDRGAPLPSPRSVRDGVLAEGGRRLLPQPPSYR